MLRKGKALKDSDAQNYIESREETRARYIFFQRRGRFL